MTDELRTRRGRRITVDPFDYPDLSKQIFTVSDVKRPRGTDAVFVGVTHAGKVRWFREDETSPASAPTQESPMSDEQKLISMATKIAAERRIDLAAATKEAGKFLQREAEAWLSSIRSVDGGLAAHGALKPSEHKPGQAAVGAMVRARVARGMSTDEAVEATFVELTGAREMQTAQSFALSSPFVRPGETFDAVVERYAAEHRVSLREAVHEVGMARPDLAANR